MLNKRSKLKIMFGMVAATLALTFALPHSGGVSFISSAAAMDGGDGGGDRIDEYVRERAERDRRRSELYRLNGYEYTPEPDWAYNHTNGRLAVGVGPGSRVVFPNGGIPYGSYSR